MTKGLHPPRIIGEFHGDQPGHCLICVGGIHGNEPAGIEALERVVAYLNEVQPAFRGDFYALAGNLAALREDVRFMDTDLNRHWLPDVVQALKQPAGPSQDCAEDQELLELLIVLERALAQARGEVFFLDLHTTSSPSAPFVVIGDTLRNRSFALNFPVPVILGLEEQLDGASLEYVGRHGHVTMGFEGGQHRDPLSTRHLESAIWIALSATGVVEETGEHSIGARRDRLREATRHLPSIMEVRYRHAVEERDTFVMKTECVNFHRVQEGEVVAEHNGREIRARETGRVLLPRFQPIGDDGYFLARRVRPFWLRISALLRAMHADRIAHWLPGVQRHPTIDRALLVNPNVARWFVYEIFHLLGFRRERPEGTMLVVSRRAYDLQAPRDRNLN